MAMKLSTGKVAFPIEFDNGDKDCIYFNPNDKDLREGFYNFQSRIEEQTKQIDFEKYKNRYENGFNFDIKSADDILSLDLAELNKLKEKCDVIAEIDAEYQNAIKTEMDKVFKSEVSKVIFKYCQPLEIVVFENENGEEEREIYIMYFVKQFAKELEKYGSKNSSAMNKYAEKYPKK